MCYSCLVRTFEKFVEERKYKKVKIHLEFQDLKTSKYFYRVTEKMKVRKKDVVLKDHRL